MIWQALLQEHLPREVWDKVNDSELTVYYKNGSIQRFVGCEDIDKHRGINCVDAVFDEYSEMKQEIWTTIIQPVLRENKGTATFIFTPKGKNHAWQLIQKAKEQKDWFVSVKTNDDTGTFSLNEITSMRREMPQDLYEQEIMCSFLDNAGAFFRRVDENVHHNELEGRDWQIGIDLAKYQDWTVLTPFCLNSFRASKQDRFNQIDYNLQKARIEAMYFRLKLNEESQTKIVIDSTGVGEPVYDDLATKNIKIMPFYFTTESRTLLLRNLQMLLEQDKIKIPDDQGLKDELKSFQYQMNERGRVTMRVPDGMTDDRVMSLALSVWGIKEPIKAGDGSYKTSAKIFLRGITTPAIDFNSPSGIINVENFAQYDEAVQQIILK